MYRDLTDQELTAAYQEHLQRVTEAKRFEKLLRQERADIGFELSRRAESGVFKEYGLE